jgi:hypothetical protein
MTFGSGVTPFPMIQSTGGVNLMYDSLIMDLSRYKLRVSEMQLDLQRFILRHSALRLGLKSV